MTLACEDGNSKLVEVVTVVEVDDEKHVDNSQRPELLMNVNEPIIRGLKSDICD